VKVPEVRDRFAIVMPVRVKLDRLGVQGGVLGGYVLDGLVLLAAMDAPGFGRGEVHMAIHVREGNAVEGFVDKDARVDVLDGEVAEYL